MTMQEKNLGMMLKAFGDIEITEAERESLKWLSSYETSTVENLCSMIEKTKKRGAGRKKKVDVEQIQKLRADGMTQQQVAELLNISISTVKRNEK